MKNEKNFLKDVSFFLIIAILIISTITVTANIVNLTTMRTCSLGVRGNTLIVDSLNNRIIEIDHLGNIVWEFSTGLNTPYDAERLDNDNILIADFYNDRVIEIDCSGKIVWEYSGVFFPADVERLANGNTLIVGSHKVIEVDNGSPGNIVWEYDPPTGAATSVERLANDHTLISIEDNLNHRVIEVDHSQPANIKWSYSTGLGIPNDVKRLVNGNTLITDRGNNRVIEINDQGSIVWSCYNGMIWPWDAERLANGNTVIVEAIGNRVIEVDHGIPPTIVWSYSTGIDGSCDIERFDADYLLPEGFECGIMPPRGWTEIDYGLESWTITTDAHSGNYAGKFSGKDGSVLISPGFDDPDTILDFWYKKPSNGTLGICISEDEGATWGMPIAFYSSEVYQYTHEKVVIGTMDPPYKKIVFEVFGDDIFLDDIDIISNKKSVLCCSGDLSWIGIIPGTTVFGNFLVVNCGDTASKLNWEIDFTPDWGSWVFTPQNGIGLTPEDGPVTVEVEVVVPDIPNSEFFDEVKVVNLDNSSNYCEIPIYLKTPRNLAIQNTIFQWFLERYPLLGRLFQRLNLLQ